MFFRNSSKVLGFLGNFKAKYSIGTNGQRNSKYVLENQRNFGTKSDKDEEHHPEHEDCPNKSCEKKPKKKSMLWGLLTGKPEKIKVCSNKCTPQPDLRHIGGKIYSTCGDAYVIEKKKVPSKICIESAETIALRKIEADFMHKHMVRDPMPKFTTAEQRMLDLCFNKLHPFYKRYQSFPSKHWLERAFEYTLKAQRNPTLDPYKTPARLSINRDLLEKKNLYVNYKRIDPPNYHIGRKRKRKLPDRPWCKIPVIPTDSKDLPKRESVFQTLYQKETKF